MAGKQDLSEAARTIYETGQTKRGRLGYILVFVLGVLVGGGLVLWIGGC